MTVSEIKKRIAIIGAGPAGVAMAKALGLEPNADKLFSKINVFERHADAGGLWYSNGADKSNFIPPVPSANQNEAIEEIYSDDVPAAHRFVSAMYEHLETNIVNELMRYKDTPFPKSCETFPTRGEVARYIQDYTKTVSPIVEFKYNSNVLSLTKKANEWEIVYQDLLSNSTLTSLYDYVILAQGHFDAPFIPDVPGLKHWSQQDRQSITHAKYFDNVTPYENKKVLVIGNSASGIDISTQLTTYASKVIVSSTSRSPVADIAIDAVDQIDKIVEYNFDNDRSITTENGTVIKDIDAVIFCTGYLYKIPFLKSYTEDQRAIITDGSQVRFLYKQIFYIPDPTLINIALPTNVIPFPFAEHQSQYISRVISGRCLLPSTNQMLDNYNEELASKGEGKQFHDFKFPQDLEYCNHLGELTKGTLNQGFVAESWNEPPERYELRTKTASLKAVRLVEIVEHAQRLKLGHKPFFLLRDDIEEQSLDKSLNKLSL